MGFFLFVHTLLFEGVPGYPAVDFVIVIDCDLSVGLLESDRVVVSFLASRQRVLFLVPVSSLILAHAPPPRT